MTPSTPQDGKDWAKEKAKNLSGPSYDCCGLCGNFSCDCGPSSPCHRGQDKRLQEKIEQALLEMRDRTLEEAAKACEVDWPSGMPAQAIEYAAAEVLASRIRSLKGDKGGGR
jgi:hypothetical protein